MENKQSSDKQMVDIIEVEGCTFSLEDIDFLAENEESITRYKKHYKDRLYSTILRSLTHENYDEKEAESLWHSIIDHMKKINHLLGREVGIAVASIDYLSNIKNELSDPKIIEEDKSSFVADTTTKDELTGLYLRGVFDVVLKKEVDGANRTNSPLCLLIIDIDDFKVVNDTFGHQEGDAVLTKIGATLNDSIREMDTAVRYGGEEMAILMPKISFNKAHDVAQRIREAIEKIQFGDFSVTVSIGVSQTSNLIKTPEKLIRSADDALYEAKAKGKNQVVLADNSN